MKKHLLAVLALVACVALVNLLRSEKPVRKDAPQATVRPKIVPAVTPSAKSEVITLELPDITLNFDTAKSPRT